jgi:hypothetical protein
MRPVGKFKRGPIGPASIRKKKDTKTLDLTEVVTCYAVGFMLYRIIFLLQLMIFAPPAPSESSQYNANWVNEVKSKAIALDYSKLKGIRSSSGRTFLKYVSSPWETKWSKNMDDFMRADTVCNQVSFDSELIRTFFNSTCTSMVLQDEAPKNAQGWCILDDTILPIFFNVGSGKISGARPGPLKGIGFSEPQAVKISGGGQNDVVFSRFLYRDDETGKIITEYVEPLISRLRHPLDCCEHAYQIGVNFKRAPQNCLATQRLGIARTQFLPPVHVDGVYKTAHFFDAGSRHWKLAKSALTYVSKVWKRHGIDFAHYHVYEATSPSKDKFLSNVPDEYKDRIDYRAADTSKRTDFIQEIVSQTTPDDYVLFKLDLNDPAEELHILEELLANRLSVLDHVDELLYTIPIPANISANAMRYGPWYQRFLQLRQAGVRAHSFTMDIAE